MDSLTIVLIVAAGLALFMYLKRRKGRIKNDDFQ